jgi:hypothetical protein
MTLVRHMMVIGTSCFIAKKKSEWIVGARWCGTGTYIDFTIKRINKNASPIGSWLFI